MKFLAGPTALCLEMSQVYAETQRSRYGTKTVEPEAIGGEI